MTALVYLRSTFGFVFLGSKAVFYAFTWAFMLFFIYAWKEPQIWHAYRAVCLFGAATVVLYYFHLLVAFTSQIYRRGEHDKYSGTSHALRAMRALHFTAAADEINVHLWVEPAAILLLAILCRLVFNERQLSTWFFVVALCMAIKETMNYWAELRRRKAQEDLVLDAEQQGGTLPENRPSSEMPKETRKEFQKRERNTVTADERARETRFAELLRLRPPFDLKQAEANFKTLIKLEHSDPNDQSPEHNTRATELIEARDFFCERLGE